MAEGRDSKEIVPGTPDARVSFERVPCARRPHGIGGGHAGERPACAGCSPVSVASSRARALLTPLMLRGAESGSQLLLIVPSDSLMWYPNRGDLLIFPQWVGTNYEARSGRNSAAPRRPSPAEN